MCCPTSKEGASARRPETPNLRLRTNPEVSLNAFLPQFLRIQRDIQRAAQREVQLCLRGDFDGLAFCGHLHSRSCPRSNTCADCGAFTASSNGANNSPHSSTNTSSFGGLLSAGGRCLLIDPGAHRVALPIYRQTDQL